MSSNIRTNLPSLQLQLRQIIDHMETMADDPDALLQWGTEVGSELEDEAERLADLSARIANAHRKSLTPLAAIATSVG